MEDDRIKAPFTDEQVERINKFQNSRTFHPYTCMGAYCNRSKATNGGILIAKNEGLVCPCGKYQQYECNSFMVDYDDDMLE